MRRLRVRRVDEHAAMDRAVRVARSTNRPAHYIAHGGSVSNSYGYPASTEAVLALALPTGEVAYRLTRLPANKVTLSGACRALGAELLVPRYDNRYSTETWGIARGHVDRWIEEEVRLKEEAKLISLASGIEI